MSRVVAIAKQQPMPKNDMKTRIPKLAHIATERTSKTNTKQAKPNKPSRIQPDQNIASPQLPNGADGKGEALRYNWKPMNAIN